MLRLRRVPIDTFGENIAYLNRDCPTWQTYEFTDAARIEVHGGLSPLYATLMVVHDDSIVKPDEIGLSIGTFERINLPEGAEVTVAPAPAPPSLDSIKRKINGNILSAAEYRSIIRDVVSRRYSNMEIAAFMVANSSFMTAQEVLSLTEAVVGETDLITWENEDMVVDQHCIGGIPGNRTSLIAVPIVAAYGMAIPSVATRGITSSSGTVDTMEVLANTEFSERVMRDIVAEHRGCIVCNNALKIAPADDVLLNVEKALGISIPQQIVASIISNKAAAGVTHLVIDIPVGPLAKVRSMPEAMRLRKLFEYVCNMMGIDVEVVVTDGTEPVGQGIGPVLEARDVMKVLRCKSDAPQDLREKSLFLAGRMLEFDNSVRGGQGYAIAREILDSGQALEVMSRIIHAQGKASPPSLGHLTRDVTAQTSGIIESIDTFRLSRIAALSGCPRDKGAGIDLFKKVGDKVEQGETLYRIHASRATDFAFANSIAEVHSGYEIIYRSDDD